MRQTDITSKANALINSRTFTKKSLAEELGLTRPTLDARLTGKREWKKLEMKWITQLTQ